MDIESLYKEAHSLKNKGFNLHEIASRLKLPPVIIRIWFKRVTLDGRFKRKSA